MELKKLKALVLLLTATVACHAQTFSVDTISDQVFQRMKGKSFKENGRISRSNLRYLRIAHYDKDGRQQQGELVCNKLIANDLIEIFKALYQARYPIEQMRLVDDYDADDERSMAANNTSCFNYRAIAGSQKLSKHSLGMAVDINPLYNPCVRRRKDGSTLIQPKTGKAYADRRKKNPYKIKSGDACHRLFTAHGFQWGGSWRSVKDYQHFER